MEIEQDRMTTGHLAVKIGCGLQAHHIDRLCRRGLIPFQRAGRIRLILIKDLDAVRAAAMRAGYIGAAPEVPGAR